MRPCKTCSIEKPLDEFYVDKMSADGRQRVCKVCSRAAARKWNEENKDRKNETGRAWYQANHDKIRVQTKAYRDLNAERIKEQKRESYQRNREANLERMRAYQKSPKGRDAARRAYAKWKAANPRVVGDNWRLKLYGLTPEAWDAMVVAQSGRCDICNDPGVDLCVDHDHVTGKVRALLCARCNGGLGLLRDDPQLLAVAIEYLNRHSVSISQKGTKHLWHSSSMTPKSRPSFSTV